MKPLRVTLLVAVVMLSGCLILKSTPRPDRTGPRPTVAVYYYPYGPSLDRQWASPRPRYHSWTNERMENDLQRLAEAGVDRIYLVVRPNEVIADAVHAERYAMFLRKVAASKRFSVVFLADCRRTVSGHFADFLDWAAGLDLYQLGVYQQDGARAIVLVEHGLLVSDVTHPAIKVVELKWDAAAPDGLEHRRDRPTEYRVWAARWHAKDEVWDIPRDGGDSLRAGIAEAIAAGAAQITVMSWNNYTDGSCIEPNTIDRDKLMRALRDIVADWPDTAH